MNNETWITPSGARVWWESYPDDPVEPEAVRSELEVCDSCLLIAYDHGFSTYNDQALAMSELGAEVEDHLCDYFDEPELARACDCACYQVKGGTRE